MTTDARLRRVFVIDDDDVMLLACRRVLEKDGYEVETFASPQAGLARIEEPATRPQLLLVDLKMPELDGLQVIERVRAIDPLIVIAVITGYATIATAVAAMSTGAHDFLPKPFTPDELRLVTTRAAERWRLVQEAEHHRREREAAERRIVTFVSHQLKSPVAAAKQNLDVLLFTSRDELPARAADVLGRIQGRLDEMLTMLDDWLTLARIERGAVCEASVASDIAEVTREVVQSAAAQADAAGVQITTDLQDHLRVPGDHASLAMLLSNLVGNAVKYTPSGGSVRVRAFDDGPAAAVEVGDTGIGIDADALPHVFDEFYRGAGAREHHIAGSGLGLAICRRIVSELHGDIAVASTPGAGSTFTVHLPHAAGEAP